MRKIKLMLMLLPLILGVFIYLLYRSEYLLYFKLVKIHSFTYEIIINLRVFFRQFRFLLPNWFVYSFPDGLWIFSFGIALLMDRKFFKFNFILFSIIYVLIVGLEFLQKKFGGFGSVLGTFDILDIIFFTLGYFGSSIIAYYQNDDRNCEYKKEIFKTISIVILFLIVGFLPILL